MLFLVSTSLSDKVRPFLDFTSIGSGWLSCVSTNSIAIELTFVDFSRLFY